MRSSARTNTTTNNTLVLTGLVVLTLLLCLIALALGIYSTIKVNQSNQPDVIDFRENLFVTPNTTDNTDPPGQASIVMRQVNSLTFFEFNSYPIDPSFSGFYTGITINANTTNITFPNVLPIAFQVLSGCYFSFSFPLNYYQDDVLYIGALIFSSPNAADISIIPRQVDTFIGGSLIVIKESVSGMYPRDSWINNVTTGSKIFLCP
jgi:hypothetical protein